MSFCGKFQLLSLSRSAWWWCGVGGWVDLVVETILVFSLSLCQAEQTCQFLSVYSQKSQVYCFAFFVKHCTLSIWLICLEGIHIQMLTRLVYYSFNVSQPWSNFILITKVSLYLMMSLLTLLSKIMMIGRVIKIMVVRNCKLDEQLKRNVCNRLIIINLKYLNSRSQSLQILQKIFLVYPE